MTDHRAASPCPLDGSVRLRKRTSETEWLHCPWCGQDEQIDDDPIRRGLMEEWR
jgi:hypothetical protein